VEDLAAKLERVLALPPAERRTLQDAARRAAVERWSWEGVSARLLLPFSN
jgi:glycosyltransferase involved in cell wall biosynthesis